jgi:Protein of unknown function (DUF1553)/Protein of unknown function (DUF1549)/Planctomycete cytochrome C
MRVRVLNKNSTLLVIVGMIFLITLSPIQADDTDKMAYFEAKVRPILFNHCFKCHGEKKQEGGLRTDLHENLLKGGDTGPAVIPGKPEESELIDAIKYDADSYQMPPDGKLKQEQIDILTQWVKEGAHWPENNKTHSSNANEEKFDLKERAKHWSFQPVVNVKPPEVKNKNWPQTPIDYFILSELEKSQISPATNADKRTLLRRITFDLIGLPPTSEEINQFLEDESPAAYSKVVERLLGSPHYGERWARHWLDLVRYSETLGHEFDYTINHSYLYRDYVIRAFNDDIPYQQIVIEHIAGDLLKSPRRNQTEKFNESVIGTGFYWFGQGKHSPVDVRAEEADVIDNQIDVLGKTFLGLTISCARCHDHKFDAITTKDYYALSGYMQSSRKQYAFIDSPEKTDSVIHQLNQLKNIYSHGIQTEIIHWLQNELQNLDERLLTSISNTPASKQPGDFWNQEIKKSAQKPQGLFYLWNRLKNSPAPEKYLEEKNKILSDLNISQTDNVKSSVVFDTFDQPFNKNWFVHGLAFGSGPTQDLNVIFSNEKKNPIAIGQLASPGIAHSGLVSRKLKGVIQSKTFTITEPYIYYRVLKLGGIKTADRRYKRGQVSLIVDGFEIIQNPIYGSLSLNISLDGQFRWYQQNVSKWIGHNAYIEITDEDDGYIAVDEIIFGKSKPNNHSNLIINNLLINSSVKTREKLAKGYKELFLKTISQWEKQPESLSPGQVDLINQILKIAGSSNNQQRFPIASTKLIEYIKIESQLPVPEQVISMVDGSSENESVFIRGNHKKKGDVVPRRFLEVFENDNPEEITSGSGRMELAKNITSPENPLFARVMVNRLWHHHFGKGIVQTPDNFGKMGKSPSHPELLDYLTTEFINNGWSIKNMHRMMVLSRTYQMSSNITGQKIEELDPENILLHRMPIKRLEAEAIRDSILSVSGQLKKKMYGPSVAPFLTPFMAGRGRPKTSGPLDGNGRRSIYINVRRNFLTPMFLAFDYPTPFTTIGKRSVSNVPAQGLIMMNNEFVIQQAKQWAIKTLKEKSISTEFKIRNIYVQAFGRDPNENELNIAKEFLVLPKEGWNSEQEIQRWTDFCHVIFNVKEFVFVN